MNVFARIAVLLRQLRTERSPAMVLFVVILIASFLMAGVQRFYNQVQDEELRARMTNAPAARRNITVSVDYRLEVYDGAQLEQQMADGAASYRESLAPELQEVIQDQHFVVTLPEVTILKNELGPVPAFRRTLRMYHHSGVEEHVEWLEGTPPVDRRFIEVTGMSDIFPGRDNVKLAVIEVALSRESAEALDLGVGEVAVIKVEDSGAISAVYVSGIFRVLDPRSPYWSNDRALETPVRIGAVIDNVIVSGLVSLDGHARMLAMTQSQEFSVATPFNYRWVFAVDPAAVNVANYQGVVTESRKLQTNLGQFSTFANTTRDNVQVRNDLGRILARFQADARQGLAILGLMTVATLATVLATVAVLAALTSERNLTRSSLIRGRGASSWQMTSGLIVEFLVVCLPAGLLGWLLATMLIDGRGGNLTVALVAATLLPALCLIVLANRHNLFTDLGELLGRRSTVPIITEQRRIVLELFLVVVAIGGIVLLRRRGLAPSANTELDPMLAAVPVLLMLAVGIVVMRLHPLLMATAARLTRRRRDVVPFVALRSATARPPSAHLPLLVMVLAIGVASFALVTWRSVDAIPWGSVWVLDATGQYVESFDPADGAVPPSPLAEGVRRSLMLGSLIAMAHAVMAILISLILGAAARRREVGYLRTIGLSSRQTAALTAFEYLPMLILACPAGLVFGVVAAKLVESTINLGAATGSETPAAIAIPWLEITFIPMLLALTVALVIIAFTMIAQRTRLTTLTRIGDQ